MHGDERPKRRLAALDLLARERLGDEVEAGTAVRLGNDDSEDAQLREPGDQLEVELVLEVVLHRHRQDSLVDERARRRLREPLLVGQLEVHYRAGRPSIETAFRSRT